MSEVEIGQTVQLSDGRIGIVRFVGQPHFAAGDWIGVELEDESGKNDGSVQGERYFDCQMGKGMFLRPTAVSIIQQPVAKPLAPKRISRPSSVVGPGLGRRLSSVPDAGAGKRMSINAPSPTPAARGSRPSSTIRSPTKSPTKQLSAATSAASTPRTGTPSNARTVSATGPKPRPNVGGNRTSMGPPPVPASRAPRQSLVGGAGIANRASIPATRPPATRTSLAPKARLQSGAGRVGSIGSQLSAGQTSDGSGHDTPDEDRISSPVKGEDIETPSIKPTSPVLTRVSAVERQTGSPTTSRSTASPITQRTNGTNAAVNREIESLKSKLSIMEKKRKEDRDRLKAMDTLQAERDRYFNELNRKEGLFNEQKLELKDLRDQLKTSVTENDEIEKMQAQHESILEMATLDRELAEEMADSLRNELEEVKAKLVEVSLQVEILEAENAELGGEMSAEEKASQGWLQLERNNERLREALIRLRDMAQQTESDLREEIKSLEEDVVELGSVKEQYEALTEKYTKSESIVYDLRQQLDDAEGAEGMIEELTEKNMAMSEQIEELKTTIEELESLQELNDELEVNHVETEKEMQEDIDFKESFISEQARKMTQQEQSLEDMEYTVSRFRELVTTLQSDLEDMKASHAVTETESEQLNSRSRAMMDLNIKLQISAAKTQVKTIDLELRRLDAQEAAEHLEIVKLFLPEAFHVDRDSVLALLRFKRVEFKANLLHGFVKERVNGQLPLGHEEDIFAACEVLDKFAWVTAMCDRFVNAISHCSTEEFAKYEGALYELEPVERALNGWIDGLRRNELKEKQCAEELQRTIALMSHLGEVHIPNGLPSYADEVHMRALIMQSHLENTASAMSAARTMVQNMIPSQGDEDEHYQHFARKTESVITATRSAKVIIGKAVRALEDLKNRYLSLTPDTSEMFERCESATEELAKFSQQIGLDLCSLLHEEGRTEPFTYFEIQSSVHRTTSGIFALSESDLFSTYSNKLRTLTTSLVDLAALASDLEMTQEFERAAAPWVLRSQELKSSKTISVDAEEEIRRLKDDNHERARLIAMRDQTLEESSVKIELLESRMRDATKKNERINELEKQIDDAKKREAQLAESIESRDKELMTIDADREKWKKIAEDTKALGIAAPGSKAGQERAVATAREMETLKTEINDLQAAVRFLREDNRRAHINDPRALDWLSSLLSKPKSKEEQRKELVLAEGQDVLNELLNLTTTAKIYDLKTMPKNRLAWRPAKSTPQYHVAKQREDYESWNSWKDGVVKKVHVLAERDANRGAGMEKRSKRDVAAKIALSLPDWEAKGVSRGREVEIVNPDEFEEFRGRLGFV